MPTALKLGKGATLFVKSQLKRLPQENETWEADFRALPKPMMQTATHYVGLVLTRPHGFLRAEIEIEHSPTVNDLARLLGEAMRRPLSEGYYRPRQLCLRGHRQWHELLPHLEEIGIEVEICEKLPKVEEAYEEFLASIRASKSAKKAKPTTKQAMVEDLFPATARWVRECGYIEIGDQEPSGFTVRALNAGGMVFEDDKAETFADALAALEKGLESWFRKNGE